MTFLMSNIWWLSQYGIFLVRGISVLYHCLLYIMHHKRIQYSIHDSKSSLSWDFPYEENWMFGRVMWFNPSCFCLHYSFFPINKLIFNILNCLLTWRGFLMTTSFENLKLPVCLWQIFVYTALLNQYDQYSISDPYIFRCICRVISLLWNKMLGILNESGMWPFA